MDLLKSFPCLLPAFSTEGILFDGFLTTDHVRFLCFTQVYFQYLAHGLSPPCMQTLARSYVVF